MAKTRAKKRNYDIISWLGLIFCFAIFPGLVIETGLHNLYEVKAKNYRQQTFAELSKRNELLLPFDDERKYFHRIFSRICATANRQKNGKAYLRTAIKRLKSNYPQQFEFIVWNDKGRIVKELTDEKRYKYVLNKLYSVLKAARDHLLADLPTPLAESEVIKSNLNIVKQFLGRVFLVKTLRLPYRGDNDGSLILADYGQSRPYFWYRIGKNYGILIFVGWDTVKGNFGLKGLCAAINQKFPDDFCGYVHIGAPTKIVPAPPPELKHAILDGLSRFANFGEHQIELPDSLMAARQLSPKIKIFNIRRLSSTQKNTAQQKTQAFVKISALYIIGLLTLIFNFGIKNAFFSIRWKLLILFLYANAAPLTILGFIAYDYLQQKTIALNNEVHLESARILRDFDARLEQQKFIFTKELNQLIKNINAKNTDNFSAEKQNLLKQALKKYKVSETFLFDGKGNCLLAYSSSGKDISTSISYVKTLAEGVLKYMNRIIVKADKNNVLSKITSPADSDFIRNAIRDSQKIWPIAIGDTTKQGYWNFIGKPEEYKNDYFLLLLWSESQFQEIYTSENLKKLYDRFPEGAVFSRLIKSGLTISSQPEKAKDPAMTSFFAQVKEDRSLCTKQITASGQNYLATGMLGRKLSATILASIFPLAQIERQVKEIRNQFLGGALLSILLTTVIGILVARQFMKPVKELGYAAIQIKNQHYRHRISEIDNDEFGHLGAVINRVSEGLQELEIAKVVQESLFPEEKMVQEPYRVFGRSNVMTTLGGDYFDYFVIDDENFAVIIADVAGHGVAAALLMAMAKARVNMTDLEQRLDPAKMANLLHAVIYSLKSRNLRRMMTFQYLVFNRKSNRVCFTNAGHCYPLLVKGKQSSRFIEHIGQPLGISKKPTYENGEFHMNKNEILLLYTDGIVEARNGQGEYLGFERLQQIAQNCFPNSAENFYSDIFASYVDWSAEDGDDTTMIAISRKE